MVKKVLIVFLLVVMMVVLCGCEESSNNPLATKATNTKAHIKINDEMIVVDVKEYMCSSNGVIVVYGTDGNVYKTHFVNIVLVKDVEDR